MLKINYYRLFLFTALFCANSSNTLGSSFTQPNNPSFINAKIVNGVICNEGVLICTHSGCSIKPKEEKKTEMEEFVRKIEKYMDEVVISGYVKKIEIPKFNDKKQIIPSAVINLCVKFYERSTPCVHLTIAWFFILHTGTCTCKESTSQNQCNYCKNFIIFKNCLNLYKIENATDKWYQFEWNSLHHTCKNNDRDTTELLLQKGADTEARTGQEHMTALHYACIGGYVETTKLLLKNGVNVDAKDYRGRTALYHTCNNRDLETAKLLVKKGANINQEDDQRFAILEMVCKRGYDKIVIWLLDEFHLPIETRTGLSKSTPFICAAKGNQVKLLKLLKKRGAKIHAKNGYGWTALQCARSGMHEEAISYLKSIGCTLSRVY